MELERVLVLGCSGSGKSTFARALAQRTSLPLVHLDQEYWSPGWVERYSSSGWCERVEEICAGERWVIDGNYSGTLPIRLERATAALWLDLPRWSCLASVARRVLTSYGQVRPDMAAGCPEHWDWEFIKFIWRWHNRSKPRMARLLAQSDYAPLTQRFKSRRAAWDWLAQLPPATTGTGC